MTNAPIKNKEDIDAIKSYFLQNGRVRDYALFVVGINTGLGLGRLLELRWGDLRDAEKGEFSAKIDISGGRSGSRTYVSLNESCRSALAMLMGSRDGTPESDDYVFESKKSGPITRFRAFQIMKEVSATLGIEGNIGCRSMKKTLRYHVWRTGGDQSLMLGLCGSRNPAVTEGYLGIPCGGNEALDCPNL